MTSSVEFHRRARRSAGVCGTRRGGYGSEIAINFDSGWLFQRTTVHRFFREGKAEDHLVAALRYGKISDGCGSAWLAFDGLAGSGTASNENCEGENRKEKMESSRRQ